MGKLHELVIELETKEKEKEIEEKRQILLQQLAHKLRKSNDYTEILKEILKDIPIYYDNNKIWWIWNTLDSKWVMVDETDILIHLKNTLDISNIGKSSVRNEILESLKIVGRENKPETPPVNWIQFKNYVYDIKTKQKFQPNSKYFFINPISWNLGESIETPTIDKYFEEWVGLEYKDMLYEIIAYCLYRDYPIHRLFCLIGSGRNGKSTYINLINKFIGNENICTTDLDLLIDNRFESAKLYKKLVCQLGETNYNDLKNTSLLKKLSGGDVVGFEFKQKNPFDEKNYAKIIIATNNLPQTHDKTDGFYRRWLILSFDNQFPEGKDIINNIPEEEFENLALRCVTDLKYIIEDGKFSNELTIEDRKRLYEEKSNPLLTFIKKYCVQNVNSEVPFYEFKEVYYKFLNDTGQMKISDIVLGRNLRDEGFDISNPKTNRNNSEGTCKYILGLDLKNSVLENKSTHSTHSTLFPTHFTYRELIEKLLESVEWVDFSSILKFLRNFYDELNTIQVYELLQKMKEEGEIIEFKPDKYKKI